MLSTIPSSQARSQTLPDSTISNRTGLDSDAGTAGDAPTPDQSGSPAIDIPPGTSTESAAHSTSLNGATDGSTDGASDEVPSRPRRVRAKPIRRRARGDQDAGAGSAASGHEAAAEREGEAPASEEGDAVATETSRRSSREDRRLAKAHQRQETKSKRREQAAKSRSTKLPAISYEDGQAAHVAMVRHISSLTTSLNEAHRLIGRLNAEKYLAQRELATLKKLPPPPPPPDPSWTRSSQAGPHAVRKLQRDKADEKVETFDPEELARLRASAKRRRMVVLGAAVLLAVAIVGYRMSGWTWFPDISSREAMTNLAGIGTFVQMIFIGWIFYRIARMGGKGARWLFPDVEEEHRKQLRKKRR